MQNSKDISLFTKYEESFWQDLYKLLSKCQFVDSYYFSFSSGTSLFEIYFRIFCSIHEILNVRIYIALLIFDSLLNPLLLFSSKTAILSGATIPVLSQVIKIWNLYPFIFLKKILRAYTDNEPHDFRFLGNVSISSSA